MSALQYNDEEKLILESIMREALEKVSKERESYLRSTDIDNQTSAIIGLTKKMQLIEGFISYCEQRVVQG